MALYRYLYEYSFRTNNLAFVKSITCRARSACARASFILQLPCYLVNSLF